jgi:hypothetical protein
MMVVQDTEAMRLAVLENDRQRVTVAPAIGGRVVSWVDRPSGREALWRNPQLALKCCAPGAGYDSNFYGGMDELLPCDMPETINGIACPDHGELWTLPLADERAGDTLILRGRLPLFGLDYERRMRLEDNRLINEYRIANTAQTGRRFQWKLHAALAVQPGDRIACPATTACVADTAWSRRKTTTPFAWPDADGLDMSLVPAPDGTTEFLCLCGLTEGWMALQAQDGARIECRFDRKVFPFCCYFASYGAMGGAFTGLLQPCTTLPVPVNAAAEKGACAQLRPGEVLTTTVVWTYSNRGASYGTVR